MSKTRAVPGVSGPAILSRTPRRVSTASALDTFARPTYCRALIPPSNPFEHSSNIQRMTLSWRSLRASPADGPEFGTVEGDGNTRLPGFVPAETAGTGKEIDAVRGAPKSVIEPEESSAFLIYFKPQGVGLRQVPLRIFRNDPNHNPFVVYLQGTGLVPEPEIALENGSSADLTSGVSTEQFGDVALGSSRDLSFTIHNPGSAGLSVLDISLWGGDASDFQIVSGGPGEISSGGSSSFSVRFSSLATGTRTATLRIPNNDGNEDPFEVVLTGQGATAEQLFDGELLAAGLTGADALPDATPFNDGVGGLGTGHRDMEGTEARS